ncbi:hypothetical protein E4U42_000308 [Claviceps africana]|uniref:Uncharacterized protein n=1 Tax=Claviceps africana TaxID=83212 RepID=A0A8K0J0D7_9HYPO|nr:hypothetical protein E4U42_000308 [Claviceps africana]
MHGNCIKGHCTSPAGHDRPAGTGAASHYASRYPRDARHAVAAGRICYFDPTNPYYGTFSPRYARPRPSPGIHHARSVPGPHRRRSSAITTPPAPPLLVGVGLDLGPYPAHLTHPQPMSSGPRHPGMPWERHKCRPLDKARQSGHRSTRHL